ncbi:hypothetical protein DFH29DRAFT_871153 [Suillus ampliporus]|nr:hypothetical protein DFH29DRAFT_871153 [Suillus ampliporus]
MSILDASNLIQDTNILAHLSEQPKCSSVFSQNIWKAPRSNERTSDSEEEAGNQAPEHGISDDNDQDQDQTDGENEERDGVQDQEQTLEIGDTTDFRQHEDDLDGEYGGEAQEDCLNQGISIKVLMRSHALQEAFDVLEHHQMKNGRCASSQSKSPRQPSPRCVVSTGSSALARPPKLCPVYAPFFLPRALSPFYKLKVSISAFSVTSYTCISASPPHAVSSSAFSIWVKRFLQSCYTNKRKVKTVQEDPVKLGFYPPAWQVFLQAVKLEMCLQAVLTHPIPDHQDALQLAQDVFDAELWVYHEKDQIGQRLFPAVHDTNVAAELKKVVISIAKASYDIFPKGTMARKDEVQKCVIAKATKLLKTGDYLRIPDSSNSSTNQQMKGVLAGFRETGTDKVPDLSADKCRADFNSLQRSVDALLENPDHRAELEEMLEQWAMIGAGDLDFDEGNSGGSGMEDVNIIL